MVPRQIAAITEFVTKRTNVLKEKTLLHFFRKVKGGALYISILVSITIGILLTFFILIANYNQRSVTVFGQSSQLNYNLKSAFQVAQSSYFTPSLNYSWMKNQVNDDSIRVKKINWGAYLLICAETKNRHQYLSQSGLFGTYMQGDTGLLVADNSRPVGLSGNISFKSSCYLPSAGVKPAYIEGQSYVSSSQNSAFIKRSPNQLASVNSEILNGLKQQLSRPDLYLDSLVGTLPEMCNHSFNHRTILWQTSGTRLSRVCLANNIKLVCGDVEIDSSAKLENILIVCKKARFKNGFRGKVHVIATDSITMEENCEFQYPSSFVLFSEEDGAAGLKYIQFNKGCKFFGGILAIHENGENTNSQKVFVKLHSGCEVNGFIYSADYIHLEGTINATVVANKLLLKTPSAVYENHILSCEINPKKYAHLLAVPLLFKRDSKLLCCEQLN